VHRRRACGPERRLAPELSRPGLRCRCAARGDQALAGLMDAFLVGRLCSDQAFEQPADATASARGSSSRSSSTARSYIQPPGCNRHDEGQHSPSAVPAIRPLLLLDAQGAQQDRHPPAQRTAGRALPALARERPQATPAHAELEALALQAATDAGGWGRNSGAEVRRDRRNVTRAGIPVRSASARPPRGPESRRAATRMRACVPCD
jgi:hypothetical protein